eukprot:SAG22_NODE_10922_length_509_cov_1.475610_1_plen_111_part_10
MVLARSRTTELFLRYSCEMIEYLFWHGARMQQVANTEVLVHAAPPPPDLKAQATPMLAVNGLPPELLAEFLQRAGLKGKVGIGLINGSTSVVLCGEPATLAIMQGKLQKPQ